MTKKTLSDTTIRATKPTTKDITHNSLSNLTNSELALNANIHTLFVAILNLLIIRNERIVQYYIYGSIRVKFAVNRLNNECRVRGYYLGSLNEVIRRFQQHEKVNLGLIEPEVFLSIPRMRCNMRCSFH